MSNPPTVAIVTIEFLIADRSADGCPVATGKIISSCPIVVTQESDDVTFTIISKAETYVDITTIQGNLNGITISRENRVGVALTRDQVLTSGIDCAVGNVYRSSINFDGIDIVEIKADFLSAKFNGNRSINGR